MLYKKQTILTFFTSKLGSLFGESISTSLEEDVRTFPIPVNMFSPISPMTFRPLIALVLIFCKNVVVFLIKVNASSFGKNQSSESSSTHLGLVGGPLLGTLGSRSWKGDYFTKQNLRVAKSF